MRIYFTKRKWLLLLCLTAVLISGSLVSEAQQDTLWGMTQSGGPQGSGSLFSLSPDGTNLQAPYNFNAYTDGPPAGSLIRYNGLLYGVTPYGGMGYGEIFSFNPATAVYMTVYSFDYSHGYQPSGKLTVDPANGLLYGVTQKGGANGQGVIYSFDPASGNYSDLYDMIDDGYLNFSGANPSGPLTLCNNVLYGMASGGANYGGVIFSFDPSSGTYTDLYDASDLNPTMNDPSFVVFGNLLYGVGSNGGSNGLGVLFSFDPVARSYTELVTFDGILGAIPIGIVSNSGTIYGVTQGSNYAQQDYYGELFSFSPGSNQLKTLYTFSAATAYTPTGNIIVYNGSLLGMVSGGGANGAGGIYSYNLGSNMYSDILDFDYSSATGYGSNLCQLLLIHTVGTTPQTITFGPATKNYGDAPFDGGAVASSGLPVTYSSDNPAVATVNGSQITVVGAGTANISVNQGGNATYDSLTVTAPLTVLPVPLLITADDTVRNQAQPNPVFRLTYSGFVYSDNVSSLTTLPTASTVADLSSVQATYPITVSGAVDPNYTISYQSGTLTVIGLLQHITFIDSTAVYGGPDVTPAIAGSGLPVTYTSSNPSIASVTAGQQLQILTAGTTQLIATQAGDADYAPTTDTVPFVVAPAPLTIAADNKTKVYSQADPVFTAAYSGFVNGDDTNSLAMHPLFTTTAAPGAPPGTYVINVGGAADSNYTITYVSGGYLLTPVQGDQINSVNTWFSSTSSLQVALWMTASETALIQVYDIGGKRLINQETTLTQGYNSITLPAAGWAAGAYIVRISGDNLNLNTTIRKIN